MHGLQAPRGARSLRLYRPLLLTAAVVVIVDQLTKSWVVARLSGGEEIDLLGGLVTLRLALNPGGAFGFGRRFPEFFLAATIVVILILVVWVGRTREAAMAIPLGLVLGGGLGNLIDRVFRDFDGRVVDFVDLGWWPVFNVADSCIVVGVILVMILGSRSDEPDDDQPEALEEGA